MFLRGVGAGCNTKEVVDRLRYLKAEVEDLELKERELDQQKLRLQQSIKHAVGDPSSSRYPLSGRTGVAPALCSLSQHQLPSCFQRLRFASAYNVLIL